jgi:Protein of unknown function (DUF3112)
MADVNSLIALDLNGTEILSLFTPIGDVLGTGLKEVIAKMNTLGLPSPLPAQLVNPVIQVLPGLYGDYPQSTDIAPCALFVALFGALAVANLFVFLKDWSRGHRYYMLFGSFAYCVLKLIGFAIRMAWSNNALMLNEGLASVVFIQVSTLWLNAYSVIMGHRIFTWRHPEFGASKFFNFSTIMLYLLIPGLLVMAILGQSLPFLYFFTPSSLHICHQVTQAAGILELIYCVLGLMYVVFGYTFPPGTLNDTLLRIPRSEPDKEMPLTVQPTWIEKTSVFYYPRKGSQISIERAESHAIRIINTREVPADGKCYQINGEHSHGPSIVTLILHIVLITLTLLLSACVRVSSVFMNDKSNGGRGVPYGNWTFRNYPMYIFHGAVEVAVIVYMLFFRFDLLFYIPDVARKSIRGTTEDHSQTLRPSSSDKEVVLEISRVE